MITSLFSFAPVQAEDDLELENWPVFRPSSASAFVAPSMAVDGNGTAHLAYAYDPTPGDDYLDMNYHKYSVKVRYAVLANGTWEYDDLGGEEWIQHVAIALSPTGEPHILSLQGGVNYTMDLVHWHRSNGTWTSELVRTLPNFGVTAINLLVDSNDSVHLAFSATLDFNLAFKTHVYMTNAGGDWTSDEIVTVRSSYAVWTNPPQLSMDDGRVHLAYLNVTDYDIEDWYSGNHSIELLTLENGEWGDLQVLNVGSLNRFSFGVDSEGHESVMFQQTDQIWRSQGKVRLAMRGESGWNFKSSDEDGTSFCQLIMDGDEERMLILRGNVLYRLEYSEGGWQQQPLWVPGGMSLTVKEFAAGTWDHLVLLYFDSLTQSIAISHQGLHMDLVPPALNLVQDELEVKVNWEPVSSEFADSCVVYRTGGASFVRQVDQQDFVDDTLENNSWRQTYQYRMSIITTEGEEYVGPMAEVWMEPESNLWEIFDVVAAVLVVIAIIAMLVWYTNRGRLNR